MWKINITIQVLIFKHGICLSSFIQGQVSFMFILQYVTAFQNLQPSRHKTQDYTQTKIYHYSPWSVAKNIKTILEI